MATINDPRWPLRLADGPSKPWCGIWGPRPDEPGCEAPPELVAKSPWADVAVDKFSLGKASKRAGIPGAPKAKVVGPVPDAPSSSARDPSFKAWPCSTSADDAVVALGTECAMAGVSLPHFQMLDLAVVLLGGWDNKKSRPRAEIVGEALSAIGLQVAPETASRIAERLEFRALIKTGQIEALPPPLMLSDERSLYPDWARRNAAVLQAHGVSPDCWGV